MKEQHSVTESIRRYYFFVLIRIFIVFFITVIKTSGSLNAQDSEDSVLSIRCRNKPISYIFRRIEENSGRIIFYNEKHINVTERVSIGLEDATIEEVLNETLAGSAATYKIIGKHIVIIPLENAIDSTSVARLTPNIVSGKVTDFNSLPLAGVNVFIKGSNTGTVTDINGNYSIGVETPGVTIVYSFLSYLTQEIDPGMMNRINIKLQEDVYAMSEVVVIGYARMKKEDITGAISVVSNKSMKKEHVVGLDHAIQGTVAGLEVIQNSGSPGTTTMSRIRGIGTINNSSPLFVVDGMILDFNRLNYFNVNDIESVAVLKDASASAIYGARAANGVIMVTTKKGTRGSPVITVSSYFGFQKSPKFIDIMNGTEYARTMNAILGVGPEDERYINPNTVYNTNWFEEITRIAPMQNHNISFSGGNDKSTYLFSVGYFDHIGTLRSTDFKRETFRMNSDHKVKKWLTVGENVAVSITKRHRISENTEFNSPMIEAIARAPVIPVYQPDGNWQDDPFSSGPNPVALIELENRVEKSVQFFGTTFAEISPFRWIKYRSTFGFDLSYDEDDDFDGRFNYDAANNLSESRLIKEFVKYTTWLWENTITLSYSYNRHNFILLGGISATDHIDYNLRGTNSQGPDSEDPSLRFFDVFIGPGIIEGGGNTNSLYGYFGRLNYNYNDKYYFTGTLREDASSRFGPGNKWGTFPSMAIMWKLHKEDFLKELQPITSMLLRFGWGKTGNENIGDFQYLSTVERNLNYSFNGEYAEGITPLRPENQNIKWETTEQWNLGVESSFFKNKFSFTGDYFYRTTFDMLNEIDLPDVTGIPDNQNPVQNIGKVRNKGVELNVIYRKREGIIQYDISTYWALIRNKVINLGEKDKFITSEQFGTGFGPLTRTEAGYPVASFYGYKVEGIFQSYEEINTSPFQSRYTAPGDFKFKDMNNDSEINQDDQAFIGSPHPDFTYGFNINFYYKNLDLSSSFYGVQGVDILKPYVNWIYDATGRGRNLHVDVLDAWTEDNRDTDIPRLDKENSNRNLRYSDFYIDNGSYLRLKRMELGYTFSEKLLKKLFINNLRIYVCGQNLFTITKFKGADPEIGIQTESYDDNQENPLMFRIDYVKVPTPRTVIIGFEVGF